MQAIHRSPHLSSILTTIKNQIEAADAPPETAQELVDTYIEKYRDVIPEMLLNTFASALGYQTDPRTSRQADMTTQCAEDNALTCFATLKGIGKKVKQVDWVAAQVTDDGGNVVFKKLCPFCLVAFKPRLEGLVANHNAGTP